MVKAVIFDLDDTLYDEIDYCKSGFHAVACYIAEKHSADSKKLFDLLWKQFSKGDRKKIFNSALDSAGIAYDNRIIKDLVNVYRNHKPDIKLPADSKTVLEKLSKTYKLGLVTDGYMPAQRLKAESLGIINYFNAVVFTEELGREHWKPSTKPFITICNQLQVPPANCVYVADNPSKDFQGPNKLNFAAAIQMSREKKVHHHQTVIAHDNPTHKIVSFDQLEEILEDI